MDLLKKLTCIIFTIFLCSLSQVALADDTTTTEDEQPSYQNPAQAAHASNLAEAAALEPDDSTKDAVDNLEAASKAWEDNPTEKTEQDLADARQAYAEAIADRTGELSDEIYDMRVEQGMGWGDIAHALGVHPGTLGLGHGKNKKLVDPTDYETADSTSGSEIAKATKRDKGFEQKEKAHGSQKIKNNNSSNKSGDQGNNGKSKDKSNNGKGNSKK